ncbi:hypothetical protein LZ30DRAFT_777448 [Colletotrichum cereale]|nr:hypothetical protein LZ30DRAFT_777448 [Colletotrichum cereale]
MRLSTIFTLALATVGTSALPIIGNSAFPVDVDLDKLRSLFKAGNPDVVTKHGTIRSRQEPKDTWKLSNDHLPLQLLPECWQKCFQSENKHYAPDVNKIGIKDFCEDKFWAMRMWEGDWLSACSSSACNEEDGELGRVWFEDTCNAH